LRLREQSNLISYLPDIARAQLLADSLHEGTTGVICSDLYNGAPHLLNGVDVVSSEHKLYAILGTFGCGKSKLFVDLLEQLSGKAMCYVSPRKALCNIFEDVILSATRKVGSAGAKHFKCYTFEKFLLRTRKLNPGAVVIVDEIQLYPPGFLDLALFLLPKGIRLFLLGDPCQSDYDSEKDRHILGPLRADVLRLLEGRVYNFNTLSHRFQGSIFKGRLPCNFANDLKVGGGKLQLLESLDAIDSKAPYAKVALVSSF
jgi:energy-coupling factor transporter ATP-binding protein EcfA2